jgi:hypothetical protein
MLIGIILYYVFLVIGLTVITNASVSVRGLDIGSASHSGSDFVNEPDFNYYNNPFTKPQYCSGVSDLEWKKVVTADAYYLPCSQFKDASICNSFPNCNYTYADFLFFNTSRCSGIVRSDKIGNDAFKVNLTVYWFPLSDDPVILNDSFDFYTKYFGTGFCESDNATGLSNRINCEQFGCSWVNMTTELEKQSSVSSKFSTVSVWSTIGWMLTFRFDFGFEPFTNMIVNFILVVIIPLILIAVIYFIFVPF